MRSNPLPAIVTGFLLTVFAMAPTGTRQVVASPPSGISAPAPFA